MVDLLAQWVDLEGFALGSRERGYRLRPEGASGLFPADGGLRLGCALYLIYTTAPVERTWEHSSLENREEGD